MLLQTPEAIINLSKPREKKKLPVPSAKKLDLTLGLRLFFYTVANKPTPIYILSLAFALLIHNKQN
jgi:hypothetical protein